LCFLRQRSSMGNESAKTERAANLLKRLEAEDSLPSLSPVALQLVELASDEACSAKDLADLIRKDPSLTVRLLRLANSALFHSRQPVTTLEQAVVKVGFHRLRLMALSLSLRDTFPMGKVGNLDYEKFWRSSLYRALLARSLAQRIKTCDPEEAFVAGLILEIGLLILFDIVSREGGAWGPPEESLEKALAWEVERYGVDHRQVGEVVLRAWKFPQSILICLRLHGPAAEDPSSPPLARVCEQAGRLSESLFHGEGRFDEIFREGPLYDDLDQEGISDILIRTFEEVQKIADQLRLEVDGEKDLFTVMEKANRALSRISEKISDYERKAEGGLPSFENLEGPGEVVHHTLQAVAHEIRNPLLAVGGFARKLASSLDPSSDGGKYANIILDEASRLEKALSRMTAKEEAR
jgi:HD-like signal output (HDOD) protein